MNEPISWMLMSFMDLFLVIALVLILIRIMRGPSLAERVIAVDLFFAVLVTGLAATAFEMQSTVLIDVALVWALFGFLGSVIFAKFIQSQEKQK